ncbi:MAG: hypothetical protein WCY08_11735 [Rhodocyclaceae bacterium]
MAIENIRAVYFPYCIEKQSDGSWVLLNRNYKPVGFNTAEWVTYSEFPVSIKLKGLGPATLRKLSCHDEEPGDRVYLYNDGSVPTRDAKAMAAYLKKLEILLKLESA